MESESSLDLVGRSLWLVKIRVVLDMQSPSLNHCLLFKCRCSLFHCGDSLWVSVIKVIHGEFEAIVNVLRSPWDTIVRDMQKNIQDKGLDLIEFCILYDWGGK